MIEITHITKPDRHDPHSRIQEVGEVSWGHVVWRRTLDDAIAQTYLGTQYFVRRGGVPVPVERVEGNVWNGGRAYLRTVPDLTGVNNLLSLPDLPPAAPGFGQTREYHSALAYALYGKGLK